MSEPREEDFTTQSPTDSLNRPSRIIPPGSPVKSLSDLCNIGVEKRRKFNGNRLEADSSSTESSPENSISGNGMCSKDQFPECLTPTLEDSALSKMLADVADKDKHYVGGNVMPSGDESTPEGASMPVRQTPTPVECVSPFWAKAFSTHGGDISKEGPGGRRGKDSPSNERKRFPMTLTLADDRLFVVNNGRVVPDGGTLKGASATGGKSCIRYFHEGAVMELVPGTKPVMKLVNAKNPIESIDAGSAMTEKEKGSIVSPIKKCYVESGFCAYLVLQYGDPENPYLEAMNSPVLQQKLKELEKKHLTPSDEHFTPLVNIAREPDVTSKDEYTTALYFTTDKYIYFVYVDKEDLMLKKFAVGDNSPSAHPRSNMQFRDEVYLNCGQCAMHKAGTKVKAKEKDEVDSSEASTLSEEKLKADFVETESPSADSADGSSNPRSSSSQLSSPEGASINNSPGTSKLFHADEKHSANNDSEILDSGVEAN